MKKKKKDTRIYCVAGAKSACERGKKMEFHPHPLSRVRRRKTSRWENRGHLTSVLHVCNKLSGIRIVARVYGSSARNAYFTRALLIASLSQCWGMPSAIETATFLKLIANEIVNHPILREYSRLLDQLIIFFEFVYK